MKQAAPPGERCSSLPQTLLAILQAAPNPLTSLELSGLARLSERQVLEGLEHLRLSLKRSERKLVIEAASCLACGFVFSKRDRLTRPGKCPVCRANRVAPPAFSLSSS